MLKRRRARREGPSGLELSRAYYEAYGKLLLETKYPEYAGRIAAGLVYLRGELGTYSDRTIRLYGRMLGRLERQGRNLTQMDLEQMAGMYGYESLEEAERRCEREAMGEER